MRIAAGRFKGRRLPAVQGARPVGGRLKTSLFSVLEGWMEGARVLDLCAGVGGFGLEALSRGAEHVTLVEKDRQAAAALTAFLREVGCEAEATVVAGDALAGPLPSGPFDLIFLDPPYAAWEAAAPADLLARPVLLLAPEGLLVAKIPSRLDLPEDARFEVARRTRVASAAYLLLSAP